MRAGTPIVRVEFHEEEKLCSPLLSKIAGATDRVSNTQKGHLVAKGNEGCWLFVAGPEVGMRLCSDYGFQDSTFLTQHKYCWCVHYQSSLKHNGACGHAHNLTVRW